MCCSLLDCKQSTTESYIIRRRPWFLFVTQVLVNNNKTIHHDVNFMRSDGDLWGPVSRWLTKRGGVSRELQRLRSGSRWDINIKKVQSDNDNSGDKSAGSLGIPPSRFLLLCSDLLSMIRFSKMLWEFPQLEQTLGVMTWCLPWTLHEVMFLCLFVFKSEQAVLRRWV